MFDNGEWNKGVVHWLDDGVAYLSVPFTWRLKEAARIAEYYQLLGHHVIAGGPGVFTRRTYLDGLAEVDVTQRLPDTIARHNPMATRASYGCPVGCWFCIVPKMDGKTFTLIDDFVPRPILCDDNCSALPPEFQQHIVDRYIKAGVPLLDCNSGFEPATFDDEVLARWRPILKGSWRFGFDEGTEGEAVQRVFKMLEREGVRSPRKKQVYTMIDHEPFDVCMDRIQKVIAWGGEPYAQPYIKLNALKKEPQVRHDWTAQKLRHVQRWTNRHLWRKTKFEDYDANARTNPQRRAA